MVVLRIANLALAFVLELVLLAALALRGFSLDAGLAVRVLAGVGAPLAVAGLWGAFLAPRSSRRLPMPWVVLAKLALFLVGAAALVGSGHPVLALLLAATAGVNLGLAVLWRQEGVVTPPAATGAADR